MTEPDDDADDLFREFRVGNLSNSGLLRRVDDLDPQGRRRLSRLLRDSGRVKFADLVIADERGDDQIDAAFIESEELDDDDSDLDDTDARRAHGSRLRPLQDRLLAYLRDVGDEWQPWPDVVEAVQNRPLAEISPLNGRVRQAALQLAQHGRVEIRYGHHVIFSAVRLLPAGYTD